MQSGQDADDAEERRTEIANRQADANGRIVRSAGSHHGAAQCLDNGVHRFGRTRIGGAAKAGDRTINDPGIDLPREFVTYAEPLHGAAAGVLDDDVGFLHQVRIDRAGLRMLEIQSDAQLIAQAVESGDGNIVRRFPREFRAIGPEIRCIGPARISTRGILDFDYFGAKARQNERGKRSGESYSQIEDSDSIQGLVQTYFSR